MLDVCRQIARFAGPPQDPSLRAPEPWLQAGGADVILGLVDGAFDARLPDLVGARLVSRDFSGGGQISEVFLEHGTYSVALLVGQGRECIRGIAPSVRLLAARVFGSGAAGPGNVARAMAWLIDSGARIIAIPLGGSIEYPEIADQLERGDRAGVVFLAAAGNGHPEELMFPARHPVAIAVGAADRRGSLLPQCSRVPRLDLVEPGMRIAAPVRSGLIRRLSGSSVACVIAAGVAALLCSAGAASECSRSAMLAALRREEASRSPP